MKKRILALILAAALLAAAIPGASAAPARVMDFPDVPAGVWYYPYVKDIYEAGILDGYDDGTFSGLDDMPWGQAFKLILLTIGCEDPEPVEGKRWDYKYIAPAIENKLVYSFDEAYLSETPTRLEVAHMVARGLDLLSIAGESPYTDCDDGYAVKLYEKGIMEGSYDENGQLCFKPDQPITRAEMCTILWRMMRTDVSQGMFRYSNYWIDELEGVELYRYNSDLFTRRDSVMTYGGWDAQCTLGVDVSEHKGVIDWEKVKAAGVDFAIIRVGGRLMQSGGLYEDKYYRQNIEGALAAGLKVGVYFFSQAVNAQEGLEEAEFLLERIRGYDITYPVVCDWEYLGGSTARTYGVEPAEVTAGIAAFCDRVAREGYRPMLYFNAYCGYIKMDLQQLTDYDFWYAEYAEKPNFRYHFQMWQYSSKGKVDGISGNVDMNLCFVPYY